IEEGRIEPDRIDLVRLHFIERKGADAIRRELGISSQRLKKALEKAEAQLFHLLKDRPIDQEKQ
ncbi:MAG: hypothetical protein Q4A52_04750, partial [Bacillota bacterium]|nr:hypothetical protein [Bacillota bacterium]